MTKVRRSEARGAPVVIDRSPKLAKIVQIHDWFRERGLDRTNERRRYPHVTWHLGPRSRNRLGSLRTISLETELSSLIRGCASSSQTAVSVAAKCFHPVSKALGSVEEKTLASGALRSLGLLASGVFSCLHRLSFRFQASYAAPCAVQEAWRGRAGGTRCRLCSRLWRTGRSLRHYARYCGEVRGEGDAFEKGSPVRTRRGREQVRSAEEGKWNVHGVWNDANASLRVRRRDCYFGAERRERGAGGLKTSEERKYRYS